jgi:hypothetical protein
MNFLFRLLRFASTLVIPLSVLLLANPSLAQEKPANLLLKVDQTSSGPYGGEKASLCLRVYSNGKIVDSEWSRAGVEIVDQNGKKTRAEKTVSFEYQVDERDVLWQIGELEDFLKSKPVLHLAASFDPPHRAVDFVEVSTIQINLPDAKTKTINVREYYAASLLEKTKYPTALVLLMDKLAKLEDEVTTKGKPSEPPADCQLQAK